MSQQTSCCIKSKHGCPLLQEAYENVCVDVEWSRREGWCFGAKLVRGAYMHQERSRAQEIGYEDPINPDYESTSRMYHRCPVRIISAKCVVNQCVCVR